MKWKKDFRYGARSNPVYKNNYPHAERPNHMLSECCNSTIIEKEIAGGIIKRCSGCNTYLKTRKYEKEI